MTDKTKTPLVLPNDVANSFDDDYDILSFRPEIRFIEPDQMLETPFVPFSPTVDSFRDRAADARDNLNAVGQLFDALQKRVDTRGKDFVAKVDPIQDATVVAAMKRRFPERDSSEVTYEDYKQALDCLSKSAPSTPVVSADDIRKAKADPLKTDFGGANSQNGENRPELSSPLNTVKPIDTESFQKSAVLALFALMLPLLQQQSSSAIAQHLATTPHA